MKRIIWTALLVMFAFAGDATAYQQSFEWDANDPAPAGYALFAHDARTPYDYGTPIWPTDGSDHTETTATINLPDGFESAVVARAYVYTTQLDGSVSKDWSGDSNEVTAKAAVPSPHNLRALLTQALQSMLDSMQAVLKALNQLG